MIRSANSFIVKEMEDCSASILDAEGQLLAEEAGPPIQLNTVGICLKTILEHYFPPEQWRPGDVVLTNDPFAGGGSLAATHSNDYLAFHPIFCEGRRSEEHTSELQSLMRTPSSVFCLKQ